MQGHALSPVVSADEPVRDAALFGVHGGHVNVTDGRYVYMRANTTPDNQPLYEYTLMPTHMRSVFTKNELSTAEFVPAGTLSSVPVPLMRYRAESFIHSSMYGHLLFDVSADEKEEHPLNDEAVERRMQKLLVDQLKKSDAPKEQFTRLGLDGGNTNAVPAQTKQSDAEQTRGILTPLGELMKDEHSRAVLEQYAGALLKHPMIGMAKKMPLTQIAAYSKGMITDELLAVIDAELKKQN